MYSMVLVMALAEGAEAPECHWSCGCFGSGSYGGCYGGSYGGCYGGGWGSSYGGCYGGGVGYYGCSGVYGGTGGYYGPPMGEKVPQPKKMPDQANAPAPATIVVTLPSSAKLTIDDYASNQTSAQRTLVTPPLSPGQEFTYTLVAEVNQGGQLVRQTQRVTVGRGQQRAVRFTFDAVPVTAGR